MKRIQAGLAWLAVAASMAGPGPMAHAGTNLVPDPGMESLDAGGFPVCWERSGWGTNVSTIAATSAAHTGAEAMQVSISSISSGDRKAMMAENAACAPAVTTGHQYDLSVWYTTTTPSTVFTMFRHDTVKGWQYWTDLSTLAPASGYQQASVRTPPVPAGTDQITWGITLYGTGTLTTDDYSMVDATPPPPPPACGAGTACTQGSWQVAATQAPIRAVHSILLNTGDVLLMAGSGNDPSAFAQGSFKSAVYHPADGTYTMIPTPADLFCSGHVQLPDGRVLIMGGTKAYPAADGSHGYEGLNTGYIFDPATMSYQRTNDLNQGHWYPSATELGNGDVLTLGGLGPDSSGVVTNDYYSGSQAKWLGLNDANQTWRFWGLYPSMVLMQDGRLFYTGSHVFGNGLPGTGASVYDYTGKTVTDIPGLQSKDNRDQSMSLLLPPAQNQTVMTMGGGNIVTNVDANRYTDLIDLKQANPQYVPGPLLPTGTMSMTGAMETPAQGKMYLSAVVLPDGKVFETGGGLHNRADPVAEASMYDPATNAFTPGMATDPVPRTYHSSAVLLPDGRVMTVGSNPGDGSFDQRVSFYSPPYLFMSGRPTITSVTSQNWAYGSAQQVTVDSPVARAELIRPAAVTHSSDPNQRYVDLPMAVNGNTLTLNLTTNPNLAPPGWYMLFVTTAGGVPSVAKWVHVG